MNIWKHVKTGGLYCIVDNNVRIEAEAAHSVLYMNLVTSEKWVRPKSEFYDGRFVRMFPADMLWSTDYSEDGPSEPEAVADASGENPVIVSMTAAISVPNVYFICNYVDGKGWECLPHGDLASAEAALSAVDNIS